MQQQTITDQADAPAQTGATSRGTAPANGTQSAVTVDEVRELVRGVVREENGEFWGAMRQQLTPMQQRLAAMDALHENVTDISAALADLSGSVRGTRAMVQRVLAGQATEDEVQQVLAAEAEAEKQDRETRQRDGELSRLKRQEEARRQADAARPAAPSAEDVTAGQYTEIYGPLAMKIAVAEGIDFTTDLHSKLPRITAGATHVQWQQWLDDVAEVAASISGAKQKAIKPRVNVPSLQPSGGGGEAPRSNLERLARGWEARLAGS